MMPVLVDLKLEIIEEKIDIPFIIVQERSENIAVDPWRQGRRINQQREIFRALSGHRKRTLRGESRIKRNLLRKL